MSDPWRTGSDAGAMARLIQIIGRDRAHEARKAAIAFERRCAQTTREEVLARPGAPSWAAVIGAAQAAGDKRNSEILFYLRACLDLCEAEVDRLRAENARLEVARQEAAESAAEAIEALRSRGDGSV